MDKTLWLVVSFVIGFVILAVMSSAAGSIPDMITGFLEGLL